MEPDTLTQEAPIGETAPDQAEKAESPAVEIKQSQEAKPPEPLEEPKQAEKKEEPAKDLEFFLKRIGELETEKKEMSATLLGMKEAEEVRKAEAIKVERDRKEKARADLLVGDYKILKPEYMNLAPSVDLADPTTDQGKEALRQWMTSNPGLFGKAPELPTAENKEAKPSFFGGKGWTWADKFKEQS